MTLFLRSAQQTAWVVVCNLKCCSGSVSGFLKNTFQQANFQVPNLSGRLLSTNSAYGIKSFATNSSAEPTSEGEQRIRKVLLSSFPLANTVEVQDISGGCGSMYQIYIEAEEFRGKRLIEQQRMVNSVLEKEIKAMHGLSLQTAVPAKSNTPAHEEPPIR